MTRVLRIAVDLPDLAPAQARVLWEFFEELASQVWCAYELELFDFEAERFHASDREEEPDEERGEENESVSPLQQRGDDPDPDF